MQKHRMKTSSMFTEYAYMYKNLKTTKVIIFFIWQSCTVVRMFQGTELTLYSFFKSNLTFYCSKLHEILCKVWGEMQNIWAAPRRITAGKQIWWHCCIKTQPLWGLFKLSLLNQTFCLRLCTCSHGREHLMLSCYTVNGPIESGIVQSETLSEDK